MVNYAIPNHEWRETIRALVVTLPEQPFTPTSTDFSICHRAKISENRILCERKVGGLNDLRIAYGWE